MEERKNEVLKKALLTIKKLKEEISKSNESIAIVGMACRFPGGCDTPEKYWNLIKNGEDSTIDIPKDRWDIDRYYDSEHGKVGKMYIRQASFLKRNIKEFDAKFFKISPVEANAMDPQQRQLLEVCWEALENSGQNPVDLRGSKTGVFIGISSNLEYGMLPRDLEKTSQYEGTGNSSSVASGRLAYLFGWNGPALSIDTACSSSLASTLIAVESLQKGKCDMAVCGGVNLMLSPDVMSSLCMMNALSESGKCMPFDASGDGYGRGEGCGIVVLKRFSDAKRDGDRIYAVISGGAMNNDGTCSGLTVPNGKAQKAVIEEALKYSKVKKEDVSYIETHGTGTVLGDPIEMKAIAEAYGGIERTNPLYIGAVKGNLGHLESAAGIAGLIKVALCLYNKEIPPVANFKVQNPRFEVKKIPAIIPKKLRKWEVDSERKRIAGLSALGFSGTNVHLIVSEAEEKEVEKNELTYLNEKSILTLKAKEESALVEIISRYKKFLLQNPETKLSDVSYTTNVCRPPFDHRVVLIGDSTEEIINKLSVLEKIAQIEETIYEKKDTLDFDKKIKLKIRSIYREMENGTIYTAKVSTHVEPKLVFKFSANTKQMLKNNSILMNKFPIYKEEYQKCLMLFEKVIEKERIEVLKATNELIFSKKEKEILLFASQYAMKELLKNLGIEPEIVFGERTGSYIAAITAGIMNIETAVKCFIKRLEHIEHVGRTKSLRINSDQLVLEELMETYNEEISISAVCSNCEFIVTGIEESIDNFASTLHENGILVEEVNEIGWASCIYGKEKLTWNDDNYNRAKLRYMAETEGEVLQEKFLDTLLQDNLEKPIQYEKSMKQLYEEGYRFFVEIGDSICEKEGSFYDKKDDIAKISLINDCDLEGSILKGLAKLYSLGVNIKWNNFYQKDFYQKVVLPNYPFASTEHWLTQSAEEEQSKEYDYYRAKFGNPLEAKEILLPYKQKQFEFVFTHKNFKDLLDNSGVVHMGYYLEMLARTIPKLLGNIYYTIKDMEFYNAIMVFEEDIKEVLLSYDIVDDLNIQFSFYSKNKTEKKWTLNVQGIINKKEKKSELEIDYISSSKSMKLSLAEKFYEILEERGFYFGKTVKWVDSVLSDKSNAVVSFRYADKNEECHKYELTFHPGILDSCAQTCNYLTSKKVNGSKRYMIKNLDGIEFYNEAHGDKFHAYVKKNKYLKEKDELICSIHIEDEESKNPILTIRNVKLKVFDENKLWRMNQIQSENGISKDGVDVNFLMKYSGMNKVDKMNYIIEYVKCIIANELGIELEKFDENESFDTLGVDSMNGLNFYQKLVQLLGIDISFFDLMQAGTCVEVCKELTKLFSNGTYNKEENVKEEQTVEQWIYNYEEKPNAKIRLFCFPYGFGSASIYKEWQEMLGDEVDVCPVKIPGLDMERMKEKPPEDIDELMETLNSVISDSLLDLPCMSFGHSWGALFAYRLANKLTNNPKANFVRLFVSGYTSPSLPNTSLVEILSELKKLGYDHIPTNEQISQVSSIDEISKSFVSAWGMKERETEYVLDGTKYSLPLIVSSYRLIEKFKFKEEEKFNVPIIGFHGIDDYRVSFDDVNAWNDISNGKFKLYTVAGDHGFIDKNQSEQRVIEILKKELYRCIEEK